MTRSHLRLRGDNEKRVRTGPARRSKRLRLGESKTRQHSAAAEPSVVLLPLGARNKASAGKQRRSGNTRRRQRRQFGEREEKAVRSGVGIKYGAVFRKKNGDAGALLLRSQLAALKPYVLSSFFFFSGWVGWWALIENRPRARRGSRLCVHVRSTSRPWVSARKCPSKCSAHHRYSVFVRGFGWSISIARSESIE